MSGNGLIHRINGSAVITIIGIVLMFASAIAVTLVAPAFVDSSWTAPTSAYQVQMYEVADADTYISTSVTGGSVIQVVHHLKKGHTLLAFTETETVRIVAPRELEQYVTRLGESELKLTSDLLLLRNPSEKNGGSFDGKREADSLQQRLQGDWKRENPNWKIQGLQLPRYDIQELYVAKGDEAFSLVEGDGVLENWVDEGFKVIDADFPRASYHADGGVVYVSNPVEYRISRYRYGAVEGWEFDPNGAKIENLAHLQGEGLGYLSRKQLVAMGETLYANEGCFNCHTDQTRTLVQDTVLNGSESHPAPPSSANEYIYQRVTFPGTRRIGPDLSRVGVKRPSRDWHKSHFWSPKTASVGTIMPAFKHFFDDDPRGTSKNPYGVPNYKFEAVFQYLMTKGTRITPPTQAWWQGKDPIQTLDIIEGKGRGS